MCRMGMVSVTARNVAVGVIGLGVISGIAVTAVEWDAWFSGPAGAAGVKIKNNDSNNRISQAQQWSDAFNTVKKDSANIKSAVKSPNLGYDLADLQSQCRDDVSTFNQLHDSPLTMDWKPNDVPVTIDQAQYCDVS